jgi:hypothetical protein
MPVTPEPRVDENPKSPKRRWWPIAAIVVPPLLLLAIGWIGHWWYSYYSPLPAITHKSPDHVEFACGCVVDREPGRTKLTVCAKHRRWSEEVVSRMLFKAEAEMP